MKKRILLLIAEWIIKMGRKLEGANLDMSIKVGDKMWFTYKLFPKENDWIEVEVLDINWAYRAVAVQLEGYKGPTVTSIGSIYKEKYKSNYQDI